MKSTFKKSPIAIAVMALAVHGIAMADAVDGNTMINDDLHTASELRIDNKNTEMNNVVNYTENDDFNLTTNRTQNNEQNTIVNEDINNTNNLTDTSVITNTNNTVRDTTASNTTEITGSKDVSLSKSINLQGDLSLSGDISHSTSIDITEDHSRSATVEKNNVDAQVSKDWDESKHVVINVKNVELTKKLSLSKDISIEGGITVSGVLTPDSSAVAVIDDKQFNTGNGMRYPIPSDADESSTAQLNGSSNYMLTNEASSGDEMMSGASGNIAVNINGGDNNMQDNASALASADTGFIFGIVDAEVFVRQESHINATTNHDVKNLAMIGESAFTNANGNIGVNFAAGNSNLQKNNFAAAVANGVISEASVNTQQNSSGNMTSNSGSFTPSNGEPGGVSGHFEYATVDLEASLSGYDVGTMSGSYADPANPPEETGTYILEGGEYDPQNGYNANHEGDIGANETSQYQLSGTFTGEHPYYVIDECGFCGDAGSSSFATNRVSLDNQAFMGASGNIGANMAAGSGNLQSNSLAMSVTGR